MGSLTQRRQRGFAVFGNDRDGFARGAGVVLGGGIRMIAQVIVERVGVVIGIGHNFSEGFPHSSSGSGEAGEQDPERPTEREAEPPPPTVPPLSA